MSIPYKVIKKTTALPFPQEKYYALAVIRGDVDLEKMAKKLSDGSTLRKADVYAVLIGLIDMMKLQLEEGYRVKLGELGSFSLVLNSKGSENPEEVDKRNIIGNKILYRPTRAFKNYFKSSNYTKYKKSKG